MFRIFQAQEFIRRALRLGLPVAGAYVVVTITLLWELHVVGKALGAKAMASVSLAANFTLVLVLAFHAIEIAGQAIIARRFGERNYQATGACLDNALVISVGTGTLLMFLFSTLGPDMFLQKDPEVAETAFEYFRWRLLSMPFLIAVLAIIGFFNGIGKPKVPLIVYSIVLAAHCVLLYGIVGGNLGMPALGVRGAGLAHTITTVIGAVVFAIILAQPHYRREYGTFNLQKNLNPAVMKTLTVLSIPILVQQLALNSGTYVFQWVSAHVPDGGVSLAAASVAINASYITTLPGFGLGIAAATMAGHYLGARQPRRASISVVVCMFIGLVYMAIFGVLFFFGGEYFMRLFVKAPEGKDAAFTVSVVNLGAILFMMLGVQQLFEATNGVLSKALQGVGLTRFVMFVTVGMQWFLYLPLVYYASLHPIPWLGIEKPLGAIGAYGAQFLYLALCSAVWWWKFLKGDWKETEV